MGIYWLPPKEDMSHCDDNGTTHLVNNHFYRGHHWKGIENYFASLIKPSRLLKQWRYSPAQNWCSIGIYFIFPKDSVVLIF
jgi:hypothetical protein